MLLLVAAAALTALVMSITSIIFVLHLAVEVKAMQKSTHTYVMHNPLEPIAPLSPAEREKIEKAANPEID